MSRRLNRHQKSIKTAQTHMKRFPTSYINREITKQNNNDTCIRMAKILKTDIANWRGACRTIVGRDEKCMSTSENSLAVSF